MRSILFFLSFLIIASSCQRANLEKEKQFLLAAYKEERKARVLGDFISLRDSQDSILISVHDGLVQNISRQQIKDSLQQFFKTAQYDNWDDQQPPIITISSDGKIAAVISKIYVRRSMQNNKGSITQEEFIYAGMATYRKAEDKWLKTAQTWTIANGWQK